MLVALLRTRGPLSFAHYMELALYHEEHGYYSDPSRQRVGRGGDFATNPSVGPAYGCLLAHRIHQLWLSHGSPATLPVVELGPEDGTLALDFLAAARARAPEFHAALRYVACEHSARKRAALHARFAATSEPNLRIIASPSEFRAEFGAILANEILDALPVRLVRFTGRAWKERLVTLGDDGLAFTEAAIVDPALQDRLRLLGSDLPEGYETEVCLRYPSFFRDLAAVFDRALLLLVDYGFAREDYYHPDRTTGTLRTYSRHAAGEDPLDSPGLRDLTAHVDFTSAMEAARLAGLELLGFARQESYLTHLAAPLLRELTDDPAARSFLRQFRTLTHPGFFGASFHVMELAQGVLAPTLPSPFRPGGLAL